MTTATAERFYTTGETARLLAVPEWRVARLYRAGVLPEPARHAGARVLGEADVERCRAVLVEQGVLPRPGSEGCAD